MARYFSRPRGYMPLQVEDDWYVDPMVPALCVTDHEAIDTGLMDHRGDPIMRAPNPVGFGRDDEW